jgi:hypothetical protein
MPDVREIIKKDALSVYRMRRAADQIRCAIYMLVQDRVAEAKTNLIQALKYGYIIEALKMLTLKRPQEFAFFCIGSILLASSYLGLGNFSGNQIYKLFQRYSKSQREPIKILHSKIIKGNHI